METLNKYYKEGLILYPRVENGYITEALFSYFPHPTLNIINKYLEPLKRDYYETNEKTFLLYLHNMRYINISQVANTQKIIQSKFKKNKIELDKNDVNLLTNYENFMLKKGEREYDYFLKQQLNHYSLSKPTLLKIDYNNENFLKQIVELHENINNPKIHKDLNIESGIINYNQMRI